MELHACIHLGARDVLSAPFFILFIHTYSFRMTLLQNMTSGLVVSEDMIVLKEETLLFQTDLMCKVPLASTKSSAVLRAGNPQGQTIM